MTDQQIENWRKILCGMLGPYALIMPREEIEKIRDNMQKIVDKLPTDEEDDEISM